MRLGRYIVQELFGWKGTFGAIVGTLITVALPFYLIFRAAKLLGEILDTVRRVKSIARRMTLLSITVWLYQARKRIAFTLFR